MANFKKTTTITEIAALSGVSRLTVAAVLRGKSGISEKTRNKVLSVIREHDLKPRIHSPSVSRAFSNMIGVVVRDITNPFYNRLIEGLGSVLRQQNFRMLHFDSGGVLEEEIGAVEAFVNYQVSGVVLTPSDNLEKISPEEHIKPFTDNNIPVVAIGNVPGQAIHCLDFEDRQVGHMATSHLIDMGHSNIFYISGPQTFPSNKERQIGFIECMVERNVPFADSSIIKTEGTSPAGYRAALQIFEATTERPMAVCCFNDLVALGVYKAAHERGIKIPEELSVIGCDDIELASSIIPSLTTLSLPTYEMGQEAGNLLLDSIQGRASVPPPSYKAFLPQLIRRESVLNLRSKSAPAPAPAALQLA